MCQSWHRKIEIGLSSRKMDEFTDRRNNWDFQRAAAEVWSADTVASVYRCPWVTIKSWEVYCLQSEMWIMQTMRYCSWAQAADLTHALSAQTQSVVQHTMVNYSPAYTTSLNYLLLLQETSAHPGHSAVPQTTEDEVYVLNTVWRKSASYNSMYFIGMHHRFKLADKQLM